MPPRYSVIIFDCPLLFETGLHLTGFKKIIVVTCDEATALRRIVARDSILIEEARARWASQLPIEQKKRLADIVIDNSGTLAELRARVEEVYQQLTEQVPE